MLKSKYYQLVSFGFAALLQTGALSAAEQNNLSTSNTQQRNALSLNSKSLGLTGPIEINSSYNEDYGIVVGASFASYINNRNAVAFETEWGDKVYRLNGTWGFAFDERNRVKLSLERLAQENDYDFASGTETEMIGQNALGATYQYIIAAGWLEAVEVNAYGASAESKDYDDVLFTNSLGNQQINKRRITGGDTAGTSLGVTLLPHESTRADIALHYDTLSYDMKYDDEDPSTSGVGFSTKLEHIFTKRIKAGLSTEILSTDHIYAANVSWLAPSTPGSTLELSLLGGYLDSKTTDNNNYQVGVEVSFSWNDTPAVTTEGYASFKAMGVADLKTWTRDPAVRMPEVMAVVDEAVFDAVPRLESNIPDIFREEVTPIDFTVAPHFVSADGSPLTFTADGLPNTITMNTNGRLIGNTPDVDDVQAFTITATATNQWGITQADTFILTVSPVFLAPTALPIPEAAVEEQSPYVLDLSQYFKDPNTTSNKDSTTYTSHMIYELTSKPESWTTPIDINSETGIIRSVTPLYQSDSDNTYDFEVTATSVGGSTTSEFTIVVENDLSNVFSDGIPAQTFNENQVVNLDLNNYFSDQNNGVLTYSVGSGIEGSGLNVSSDGQLSGTTSPVNISTDFTALVTAENTDGEKATRPLNFTIEPVLGTISLANGGIPAQQAVQQTVLSEANSINLNDYFTNDQNDPIAYQSDNLSSLGSVTINEAGVIVGTLGIVPANTTTMINITAYDPNNSTVTPVETQFNYTVVAVPSSQSIEAQKADELTTFNLNVTDANTGNFQPAADLSFNMSGAPAGWAIDTNGNISGPVPEYDDTTAANNSFDISVTAVNNLDNTLSTQQTFTLEIIPSGVISLASGGIPAQQVAEEQVLDASNSINLNDYFTNNQGEPIAYRSTDLNNLGNLSIDSSGVITGPINAVDSNTTTSITVEAYDAADANVAPVSTQIDYTILAKPTSQAIAAQSAHELTSFALDVADANTGNFQPAADLSYNLSGAPAGWSIDNNGVISGQVPAYDELTVANNSFDIKVSGMNTLDNSLSTEQTFNFEVIPSSKIILAGGGIPAQQVAENAPLDASNSVNLNDYFSNDQGEPIAYRSDDLSNLGSVTIDSNGILVGTLNNVTENTNTVINVEAYQPENPNVIPVATSINYTVVASPSSQAIGPQSLPQNEIFTLNVTDPGTGNFQPAANLVYNLEGAPENWTIDSNGVISGTVPMFNVANPSNNVFAITVNAENSVDNSLTTKQTFTFTVLEVPLTTRDASYSYRVNSVVNESLVAYVDNPNNEALTFTISSSAKAALATMNMQLDTSGNLSSSGTTAPGIETDGYAQIPVDVTAANGQTAKMQLTVEVAAPGIIEGPRSIMITIPEGYNDGLYTLDLNEYFKNNTNPDDKLLYEVTRYPVGSRAIAWVDADGTYVAATNEASPWLPTGTSFFYTIKSEYGAEERVELLIQYQVDSDITSVNIVTSN